MTKKRLFSGIQPSGEIHIGNYLGAIKNWVTLQETHEAIYCVVDYHAITVVQDREAFRKRIFDTALGLLATGLDPDKCTLFVQSQVVEHTELAWVLGTVIHMGHLERMTQYKQKSEQHPDDINVGLFTYPVLQAADIALYKAEVVPVGEDQVQHLELAREIVRRFNTRYGEILPEPAAKIGAAARIMGLDGKAKMSKSMNNTIGLFDAPV
ncbi:MAG: tryptophan--tRNA ligase, partial [Fibrobacteres bacterium]|nr:tryptophan--tRNA ligase [Fibrobacterota bacterium]